MKGREVRRGWLWGVRARRWVWLLRFRFCFSVFKVFVRYMGRGVDRVVLGLCSSFLGAVFLLFRFF